MAYESVIIGIFCLFDLSGFRLSLKFSSTGVILFCAFFGAIPKCRTKTGIRRRWTGNKPNHNT